MKEQTQAKIRARSDLERIRNRVTQESAPDTQTRIVVGLGTCGLAAGARPVFEAIESELARLELPDVQLVPTGCVGICQFEPVVEVFIPGQSRTTYVKMTPDRAVRMIRQHVRGGNPLTEFTIGTSRNGA